MPGVERLLPNRAIFKIENLVLWARSVPPVAGLPVKIVNCWIFLLAE
jgi:hypothetical protein